jgi:hypothetical protein
MNDKSRAESNGVNDLQISGAVQSLSDWVEIDVPSSMQIARSVRAGSPYGDRLMDLQSARRFLTARIEAEQHIGMPTAELELELAARRAEARAFLAYLETGAPPRSGWQRQTTGNS